MTRGVGPLAEIGLTPEAAAVALEALERGAADNGARLGAIGGAAIWLRCEGASDALRRTLGDLDLVGLSAQRRELESALEGEGFLPDQEFNLLHGSRRQIWWGPDRSFHADLFFDRFEMCHDLDLSERVLSSDSIALSAADLFLTKLQVIELNEKDVSDVTALLTTHELSTEDGERQLSTARLVDVLCGDWGFYTTVTDNLRRLPEFVDGQWPGLSPEVERKSVDLLDLLETAPKGRGFRMRDRVGRRKRWYRLPEESVNVDEEEGL